MTKGYYPNVTTLYNLYYDNVDESEIVWDRMLKRTKEEENMFKKSDQHFVKLFTEIVPVEEEDLIKILNLIEKPIMDLKKEINRARPWQIKKKIKDNMLKSFSADTPAFPSGHSLQSYYLASLLAIIFPRKRKELFDLAESIGQSRISAGLHYPSDHLYAKWLVDNGFI